MIAYGTNVGGYITLANHFTCVIWKRNFWHIECIYTVTLHKLCITIYVQFIHRGTKIISLCSYIYRIAGYFRIKNFYTSDGFIFEYSIFR